MTASNNPNFVHNPEGDQWVSSPPNWYKGKNRWMKTHGFMSMQGNGRRDFFTNDIRHRRKQGMSNIILVTGPPGQGKTYMSIRIAQHLDPHFKIRDAPAPDPNQDDSQVCFSREHLLYLLGSNSPLKRDQVIVIDESQYVANNREWYSRIQVELMKTLEAIRSRGFVIIIVSLHRKILDSVIREHILTHHVIVKRRGVGVVHRVYLPDFSDDVREPRLGTLKFRLLPGHEECSDPHCLTCRHLHKGCKNIRAIYERRKAEFIGAQSDESRVSIREKRQDRDAQRLLKNKDKMIEILYQHKDEIKWTRFGNTQSAQTRAILQTALNTDIGMRQADQIGRQFQLKYPELVPKVITKRTELVDEQ